MSTNTHQLTDARDQQDELRLSGKTPDLFGVSLELTPQERPTIVWPDDLLASQLAVRIVNALEVARTGTPAAAVVASTEVPGSAGSNAPSQSQREISADQTNRSIIVDDRWVVKFMNVWGDGNRGSALLQHLSAANNQWVPETLGAVTWQHPRYGTSVIAQVSEYVAEAVDGWSWAVDDVEAYVAGTGVGQESTASAPTWPYELGRLIASVHHDLAGLEVRMSSEVEPGPGENKPSINLDFRTRAFETLEQLTRDMPDTLRSCLSALKRDLGALPSDYAGERILPHGDFHVGQVLRTPKGNYTLIDFDGDPQWHGAQAFQAEPRERDLAHMLVSIDLVASVTEYRRGTNPEETRKWATNAQREFLAGYCERSPGVLLDEALLRGWTAERFLKELTYARDYLPRFMYASANALAVRYSS